jgi:hypothetical protein
VSNEKLATRPFTCGVLLGKKKPSKTKNRDWLFRHVFRNAKNIAHSVASCHEPILQSQLPIQRFAPFGL